MLSVLQPSLGSLRGASTADVSQAFDRARLYFSFLLYLPEALQKAAADKPGRFTPAEYTALLQVAFGCHCAAGHVDEKCIETSICLSSGHPTGCACFQTHETYQHVLTVLLC